jgi:tight adherence protein B
MDTLLIFSSLLGGFVVLSLIIGVSKFFYYKKEEKARESNPESLVVSEIEVKETEIERPEPKSWSGFWLARFEAAGFIVTNYSMPGYWAIMAGVVGFGFGLLVAPGNLIGGLGIGVGSVIGLIGFLKRRVSQRIKKIEANIPIMLSGMRANLQSNMTPEKAILSIAEDLEGPMGEELRILRNEVLINIPLDTALKHLSERVNSPEIQFMVASIRLAISKGIDLDPQLAIIQKIVVQRTRIAGKLSVAIAQVSPAFFLSVFLIPAGLMYSLNSSPDAADTWSTPFGAIALIVIIVLYIVGILLTRKLIANVKAEQ